jgi:hypothetical protein
MKLRWAVRFRDVGTLEGAVHLLGSALKLPRPRYHIRRIMVLMTPLDLCPDDGLVLLKNAEAETTTDLPALVAAASVWANPKVHELLMANDGLGLWYPAMRRYRKGANERKGGKLHGVTLDDNTYANFALKNSLPFGARAYRNYSVCHIWPESCYDDRCYTCIANLVLVPSPLMSITDFHPVIQSALKYRSWELYAWCPPRANPPIRPDGYPTRGCPVNRRK